MKNSVKKGSYSRNIVTLQPNTHAYNNKVQNRTIISRNKKN